MAQFSVEAPSEPAAPTNTASEVLTGLTSRSTAFSALLIPGNGAITPVAVADGALNGLGTGLSGKTYPFNLPISHFAEVFVGSGCFELKRILVAGIQSL